VGKGEKKNGVLTPPGGVKTPFFYVFLPNEQSIRSGKTLFSIVLVFDPAPHKARWRIKNEFIFTHIRLLFYNDIQ